MRKYTSSERYVEAPKRLNLLNNVCYLLETLSKPQLRGLCEVKRTAAATRGDVVTSAYELTGVIITTCDPGGSRAFYVSICISCVCLCLCRPLSRNVLSESVFSLILAKVPSIW
ncbi:hypothetical protein AVEN_142688-1 [Araneus ventricosus]|uniref:Uncharacterized protein n=1 Tax=Araneus ventricosus TaxID=182803 RepID=A0A4Y2UIC5_ARAVE|nr:hypothetical protein AVEN_142688-1 [Araneus ventricosus]